MVPIQHYLILLIALNFFVIITLDLALKLTGRFGIFSEKERRLFLNFFRGFMLFGFIFYFTSFMFGHRTGKVLMTWQPYTLDIMLLDVVLMVMFAVLIYGISASPYFVSKKWLRKLSNKAELLSNNIKEVLMERESIKIVDSIDWEILDIIKEKRGDIPAVIEEVSKLIPLNEAEVRIQKLLALGYIEVGEYRIFLTPEGVDVLNLPPILLAWKITDSSVLRKMAEVRTYLRRGEAHRVLVESSKLLEYILRKEVVSKGMADRFRQKHRQVDRATLGELVSGCKELKLINGFEERVALAFNDIRKKYIHPEKGLKREMMINDAYMAYALVEIFVNYFFSSRA